MHTPLLAYETVCPPVTPSVTEASAARDATGASSSTAGGAAYKEPPLRTELELFSGLSFINLR
jgi:hypothetical protein